MEPVYTPVILLVRLFYWIMGWTVIVSGREHVPRRGGAVLASNHIGYLDFTFIGYGVLKLRRLVRFAAKKEVFDHPVAGPLMRGMKHIPVDRDGDVNEVMRTADAKLRGGDLVGMFPEGTISRSFMPAQAKTGTVRMAMQAGAPIIPVALWGSQRIFTKGRPRNLQRGVTMMIRYGPAIAYEADEDPRDVTRRLMASITRMVTDLQDAYPDLPSSPDDRWWLPARLGGTAPSPEEAEQIIREERIARRAKRLAQRQTERQAQRQAERQAGRQAQPSIERAGDDGPDTSSSSAA